MPTAIELVDDIDKDGAVKRDEFGRIKKKQRGDSMLYKEFGVRKRLLDDLYIRFVRLAEERIGEAAEYGVVSYIQLFISDWALAPAHASITAIQFRRCMDR